MKPAPINNEETFDIYDYYEPPLHEQPLVIASAVGIVLLIGIAVFFFIRRWRSKAPPPHEWALTELKKLSPSNATKKQEFKTFYFILTKILKEYLVKRYELNIMAKTDEELIYFLEDRKFSPELVADLKKIHSNAELVKFANQDIIKTQAEKDLGIAFAFIEQTKPQQRNEQKKT